MRKISSFSDNDLRSEQYDKLVDVICGAKDRHDLWFFLHAFLTPSERAYLGQRLNIIQMLVFGKSYQEIKENLAPSTTAITNAQKCIDLGGELIKTVATSYKYKSTCQTSASELDSNFFRAHKPGSPSRQFKKHKP